VPASVTGIQLCVIELRLTTVCMVWSVDHVFLEFVDHPKMKPIKDRTVWIHVNVPGQGAGASDLPAELAFPTRSL